MTIKNRSRVFVFVFSFLVWLALTDPRDWQEAIAGLLVAIFVTLIAGQFLITSEKSRHFIYRWFKGVLYCFTFLWEMVKANLHVAYIVLHPQLPIRPGIVRIKTRLTKDSAITVLTNSITLTPGTLTVDVDPLRHHLYIHWIDVTATDTAQCTKLIGNKFEHILREVFE